MSENSIFSRYFSDTSQASSNTKQQATSPKKQPDQKLAENSSQAQLPQQNQEQLEKFEENPSQEEPQDQPTTDNTEASQLEQQKLYHYRLERQDPLPGVEEQIYLEAPQEIPQAYLRNQELFREENSWKAIPFDQADLDLMEIEARLAGEETIPLDPYGEKTRQVSPEQELGSKPIFSSEEAKKAWQSEAQQWVEEINKNIFHWDFYAVMRIFYRLVKKINRDPLQHISVEPNLGNQLQKHTVLKVDFYTPAQFSVEINRFALYGLDSMLPEGFSDRLVKLISGGYYHVANFFNIFQNQIYHTYYSFLQKPYSVQRIIESGNYPKMREILAANNKLPKHFIQQNFSMPEFFYERVQLFTSAYKDLTSLHGLLDEYLELFGIEIDYSLKMRPKSRYLIAENNRLDAEYYLGDKASLDDTFTNFSMDLVFRVVFKDFTFYFTFWETPFVKEVAAFIQLYLGESPRILIESVIENPDQECIKTGVYEMFLGYNSFLGLSEYKSPIQVLNIVNPDCAFASDFVTIMEAMDEEEEQEQNQDKNEELTT